MQANYVKLFVQIRTSVDDNDKEHANIRILSSKLSKVKEQMKGQEKRKNLYLEPSKSIRLKISKNQKRRKKHQEKLRDKFMVVAVLGLY